MASATLRVDGLRQAVRQLERLGAEVADLKGVMGEVGGVVAAHAADLAPRRRGTLAASIRPGKAKAKATVRAGGARAPHAKWVEFGSVHNKPVGFLRQAARDKQGESAAIVNKGIRGIIANLNLD